MAGRGEDLIKTYTAELEPTKAFNADLNRNPLVSLLVLVRHGQPIAAGH